MYNEPENFYQDQKVLYPWVYQQVSFIWGEEEKKCPK